MQPFMSTIRPVMLVRDMCRTVEHACVYAVVILAIVSVHNFVSTSKPANLTVLGRCPVPGNQIQSLMRAINGQLRSTESPPDMVLCLLPGNQEERYNNIKRLLECERPGKRFS